MTCPCCSGTGRVGLVPHLQETLDWLRAQENGTAQEVHRAGKGGEGVTAACNRLKGLFRLGLASRRKHGREWVYMAL